MVATAEAEDLGYEVESTPADAHKPRRWRDKAT
jgi:hypothetical protein